MANPTKSWNLTDKGDRESVIEAVKASAFVPEKMKAALAEQISLYNPRAKLIKFIARADVFTGPHGDTLNLAVTITEL